MSHPYLNKKGRLANFKVFFQQMQEKGAKQSLEFWFWAIFKVVQQQSKTKIKNSDLNKKIKLLKIFVLTLLAKWEC